MSLGCLSHHRSRSKVEYCGKWVLGGSSPTCLFRHPNLWLHAPSNCQPISTCYRKHENTKKRAYEQCVHEIEHGFFTPLVLSATGGLGNAATICYKRLASMIATKHSPVKQQLPPIDLVMSKASLETWATPDYATEMLILLTWCIYILCTFFLYRFFPFSLVSIYTSLFLFFFK